MIHPTNRSLVALLLALAVPLGACSGRSSDSGTNRVAVFEAHDIWDGDNGLTMARLGLPQQAIYRLDSLGRPVRLPMPTACGIEGLTLSPAGDRIAYLAYGADPPVTPDQRAATGVRVVDGSGSEIAWFPSCYAPCWSRDCPRAAEAGVRTVVIDPRTMEILHELPGKLVTPTNDHRSVVLLRGDTLALADLPTWVREPARPLIGRIRMQIYAWGSGALGGSPTSRLVSDSTLAVRDWLSSSHAYFGECGKIVRALRAPDASHVELEIATPMIGPLGLDTGPIAIPREMPPGGTRLTLGRAPVALRTPSVDSGYDVVLSLLQ